ncbi:MAG: 50S ribosomal protein L23 [Thermodesulfobacteriota bacterium]|nr:50S ribosomal protein L23 [Thermodesulfobacteriota bacterium]
MKDFTRIIRYPVITEKGTMLRDEGNNLVFAVSLDANKVEIKATVEGLFDVHVDKVHTMRVKGKIKNFGRFGYRKSDWKKAVVKLSKGESIEFYEGV